MQTKSHEDMARMLRPLVRDVMKLSKEAKLPVGDVATLLGTSRVTVYKWCRSMPDDWKSIEVSGTIPSTVFWNLMVVKRVMELAFANGELPADNRTSARRWAKRALGSVME